MSHQISIYKSAHSLLKAKGGSACPSSIPDSLPDGRRGVLEARHRAALWVQAKSRNPGKVLATILQSVCNKLQTYACVRIAQRPAASIPYMAALIGHMNCIMLY